MSLDATMGVLLDVGIVTVAVIGYLINRELMIRRMREDLRALEGRVALLEKEWRS